MVRKDLQNLRRAARGEKRFANSHALGMQPRELDAKFAHEAATGFLAVQLPGQAEVFFNHRALFKERRGQRQRFACE
jgi:hypothetical protein